MPCRCTLGHVGHARQCTNRVAAPYSAIGRHHRVCAAPWRRVIARNSWISTSEAVSTMRGSINNDTTTQDPVLTLKMPTTPVPHLQITPATITTSVLKGMDKIHAFYPISYVFDLERAGCVQLGL